MKTFLDDADRAFNQGFKASGRGNGFPRLFRAFSLSSKTHSPRALRVSFGKGVKAGRKNK